MSTTHYYDVTTTWNELRKGTISSPILTTTIEVATPPDFTNGMPGIWSPEHLLVAAVGSCLMTTFLAIAENSKLAYQSFSCPAKGKLELVDGKYMITEVLLQPVLHVAEEDKERALRILEKSERACLISNSIKAKIVFEPKVVS